MKSLKDFIADVKIYETEQLMRNVISELQSVQERGKEEFIRTGRLKVPMNSVHDFFERKDMLDDDKKQEIVLAVELQVNNELEKLNWGLIKFKNTYFLIPMEEW